MQEISYLHTCLLKKNGISTPFATVAFSKDAALEYFRKKWIIQKLSNQPLAVGAEWYQKLNDSDSAEGIIETREKMYPIYQIHYLEEFVERPPRDIRAIVVGDKVVAAIYRTSGNGSWKTNMALGGVAEECKVSQTRWKKYVLRQKMQFKDK